MRGCSSVSKPLPTLTSPSMTSTSHVEHTPSRQEYDGPTCAIKHDSSIVSFESIFTSYSISLINTLAFKINLFIVSLVTGCCRFEFYRITKQSEYFVFCELNIFIHVFACGQKYDLFYTPTTRSLCVPVL